MCTHYKTIFSGFWVSAESAVVCDSMTYPRDILSVRVCSGTPCTQTGRLTCTWNAVFVSCLQQLAVVFCSGKSSNHHHCIIVAFWLVLSRQLCDPLRTAHLSVVGCSAHAVMDFAPGGAGGGTKTMYTWMVSSCDPLGTAPACTLHAALSSSTLLL